MNPNDATPPAIGQGAYDVYVVAHYEAVTASQVARGAEIRAEVGKRPKPKPPCSVCQVLGLTWCPA